MSTEARDPFELGSRGPYRAFGGVGPEELPLARCRLGARNQVAGVQAESQRYILDIIY